jgi:hypothetical protein
MYVMRTGRRDSCIIVHYWKYGENEKCSSKDRNNCVIHLDVPLITRRGWQFGTYEVEVKCTQDFSGENLKELDSFEDLSVGSMMILNWALKNRKRVHRLDSSEP